MNKDLVLGLDISTSCTGLCLLEDDCSIPLLLHPLKFPKDVDFWDKVDFMKKEISEKLESYKSRIRLIVIEEPLKSFKQGFSSADTITTLIRMNGITSDHARLLTGTRPTYIHVGMARSLAGIKLKSGSESSYKDQIVDWVTQTKLPQLQWAKTKTGNFKPEVGDMCDSYVLALAGQSKDFEQALQKKVDDKKKRKDKIKKDKQAIFDFADELLSN